MSQLQMTFTPAVSRSWLLWTVLVVGLSGCRSCESKPPKAKVLEAKEKTAKEGTRDYLGEGRAKRRGKRSKQGRIGLRESLTQLKMTIPAAAEEVREVAEPVERAKALVLTGEAGPSTEARSLLTAHLQESPDSVDALYWMGRSFNAERIQVPAVDFYKKALVAEPDFVAAHRWLAYTFHAEGRCEDARPHLDAAVTASPTKADVLVDRAVCGMVLRDWDSVMVDLTAACALETYDWCEDVAKLATAEGKRQARLKKARSMEGKVGKVRKGGKLGRTGAGKFGKFGKFGKGKLGKGKLGKGNKAGSESDED